MLISAGAGEYGGDLGPSSVEIGETGSSTTSMYWLWYEGELIDGTRRDKMVVLFARMLVVWSCGGTLRDSGDAV